MRISLAGVGYLGRGSTGGKLPFRLLAPTDPSAMPLVVVEGPNGTHAEQRLPYVRVKNCTAPPPLRLEASAFAQIDLDTGALTAGPNLAGYHALIGMSGDCPLLVDGNSTVTRACAGCRPLPVARDDTEGLTLGRVSLDSTMYLSLVGGDSASTVLWNIAAALGIVRTYPPRPEEATWSASELPVANQPAR